MQKVILDVDTGVDDSFAILFAARNPEIDLLGITCVDGNTNLTQVSKNTLYVLDRAGAKEVPVAKGATGPLFGEPLYAEHVHGKDGIGNTRKSESARKVDPRGAVDLIKDLVEENPNEIILIPLGPLTNIALFIKVYPETAKKLKKIVLMGGSATMGNATATAEFNIWHDPEAAHIVFSSEVPITMYGLDVFYDLIIGKSESEKLQNQKNEVGEFASQLVNFMITNLGKDVTLGDYGAVFAAIWPEHISTKKLYIEVDMTMGPNRGQTICDHRADFDGHKFDRKGKECEVVVKVDSKVAIEKWMESLK